MKQRIYEGPAGLGKDNSALTLNIYPQPIDIRQDLMHQAPTEPLYGPHTPVPLHAAPTTPSIGTDAQPTQPLETHNGTAQVVADGLDYQLDMTLGVDAFFRARAGDLTDVPSELAQQFVRKQYDMLELNAQLADDTAQAKARKAAELDDALDAALLAPYTNEWFAAVINSAPLPPMPGQAFLSQGPVTIESPEAGTAQVEK